MRRIIAPAVLVLLAAYVLLFKQSFVYLLLDENIYINAGVEYIRGTETPATLNFEHPPLAKYGIGFSQIFLGDGRILGRILAAGTLPLVYSLFRNRLGHAPVLAGTVLLAFDPIFVLPSVYAMLEPYYLFFGLLSLTVIRWKRAADFHTFIPAVFFGLAMASKFTALLFLPLLLISMKPDFKSRILIFATVAFATYFVTYRQVFLQAGPGAVVDQHVRMLSFFVERHGSGLVDNLVIQLTRLFSRIDLLALQNEFMGFHPVRDTSFAIFAPGAVIFILAVYLIFKSRWRFFSPLAVPLFIITPFLWMLTPILIPLYLTGVKVVRGNWLLILVSAQIISFFLIQGL